MKADNEKNPHPSIVLSDLNFLNKSFSWRGGGLECWTGNRWGKNERFFGGDIFVVNLNKRPQEDAGVSVFIRRKRTPDVGGHCRGIAIFPGTSNEGLLVFFF